MKVRLMYSVEIVFEGGFDDRSCEIDLEWPALLPIGSEVGLLPQDCTVEGYTKMLRCRIAGYGWQTPTADIVLCRLDPGQIRFETRDQCIEYLHAIGFKVSG